MPNTIFAIVVDGEVAGTLVYPENSERLDIASRHIAALKSNPQIVEVTDQDVQIGWSYDGSQFNPPA